MTKNFMNACQRRQRRYAYLAILFVIEDIVQDRAEGFSYKGESAYINKNY